MAYAENDQLVFVSLDRDEIVIIMITEILHVTAKNTRWPDMKFSVLALGLQIGL